MPPQRSGGDAHQAGLHTNNRPHACAEVVYWYTHTTRLAVLRTGDRRQPAERLNQWIISWPISPRPLIAVCTHVAVDQLGKGFEERVRIQSQLVDCTRAKILDKDVCLLSDDSFESIKICVVSQIQDQRTLTPIRYLEYDGGAVRNRWPPGASRISTAGLLHFDYRGAQLSQNESRPGRRQASAKLHYGNVPHR